MPSEDALLMVRKSSGGPFNESNPNNNPLPQHLCLSHIFTLFLGRVVHLPENYSAWVLRGANRNSSNTSEDEEKSLKYLAMARTNKITMWNYDKEGELDNPISRALQWTEICDAIAISDDEDEEKENNEKNIKI